MAGTTVGRQQKNLAAFLADDGKRFLAMDVLSPCESYIPRGGVRGGEPQAIFLGRRLADDGKRLLGDGRFGDRAKAFVPGEGFREGNTVGSTPI